MTSEDKPNTNLESTPLNISAADSGWPLRVSHNGLFSHAVDEWQAKHGKWAGVQEFSERMLAAGTQDV